VGDGERDGPAWEDAQRGGSLGQARASLEALPQPSVAAARAIASARTEASRVAARLRETRALHVLVASDSPPSVVAKVLEDHAGITLVVRNRAAKGCEIPNFKGSYLGRFPLVLADFWTSEHLSARSRSTNVVS